MDDLNYVLRKLREDREAKRLTITARKSRLGYSWVKSVARGEIAEPGFKKIKKLKMYYSKRDEATKSQSERNTARAA